MLSRVIGGFLLAVGHGVLAPCWPAWQEPCRITHPGRVDWCAPPLRCLQAHVCAANYQRLLTCSTLPPVHLTFVVAAHRHGGVLWCAAGWTGIHTAGARCCCVTVCLMTLWPRRCCCVILCHLLFFGAAGRDSDVCSFVRPAHWMCKTAFQPVLVGALCCVHILIPRTTHCVVMSARACRCLKQRACCAALSLLCCTFPPRLA